MSIPTENTVHSTPCDTTTPQQQTTPTAKDIAYKLRFRAKCQVPTFPSLRVAKGA